MTPELDIIERHLESQVPSQEERGGTQDTKTMFWFTVFGNQELVPWTSYRSSLDDLHLTMRLWLNLGWGLLQGGTSMCGSHPNTDIFTTLLLNC